MHGVVVMSLANGLVRTGFASRYRLQPEQKEGIILFNDAFYLRLYGVRHMVKDHSDRERGNPLPPHRLLFSISSLIGNEFASPH